MNHEDITRARAEEMLPYLKEALMEELRPRRWVGLPEAAEIFGRSQDSLRGLWKRYRPELKGIMRKEGGRLYLDVHAFARWDGTD